MNVRWIQEVSDDGEVTKESVFNMATGFAQLWASINLEKKIVFYASGWTTNWVREGAAEAVRQVAKAYLNRDNVTFLVN